MPDCSVPECTNPAVYEVILYDIYLSVPDVFFERDYTCPFICNDHMVENETNMIGTREPRHGPKYPHTNRHNAQGFTIYRPLVVDQDHGPIDP